MKVIVSFDFEGQWGMPAGAHAYDLGLSTRAILDCLAEHDAHAVFFVVGELAVRHPELMAAIHARGHEIGLHGWRHEHIDELSAAEFSTFSRGIETATADIERLTGVRPLGFRAPYLLGPRFHDPRLSQLLNVLGFRWISNREIRWPLELLRPDRARSEAAWQHATSQDPGTAARDTVASALLLACNAGFCLGERALFGSTLGRARWLLSGAPPFERDGLIDIPLYSPMDCDLLGLPHPLDQTADPLMRFANAALARALTTARPFAMFTFHDWLISSANRLVILDQLLAAVEERGFQTRPPAECWETLMTATR